MKNSPYLDRPLRSLAEVARVDEPRVGLYWCRLVRGGPRVAVEIFWLDPENRETLDRPHRWGCRINGQPADPYEAWTRCADKPISRAEFDYLQTLAATPGQPEAAPRTGIDPMTSPIPF